MAPADPAPSSGPGAACPVCGTPLNGRAWCTPCLLRGAVKPWAAEPVIAGPEDGMPGEFGDYRLRQLLGEGGMGIVYRATKVSLRKDVAIKFLKGGRRATDRQVALFLREAELASQLDHPNIVGVSEVGERDGARFLVMRFVEGESLAVRMHSAEFLPGVRERAELVAVVARAVHHAHQRGVIHRDLKPGNILIARDGSPHVVDFGLARWVERDTTVTVGDRVVGTPAYMPPEQARGRAEDPTIAGDVWSLGVVLYQLVSGRLPFEAENLAAVLQGILHDDPPGPFSRPGDDDPGESVVERCPRPSDVDRLFGTARRDLESICLRCLEKEPARRYPTALALAEDLDRWRAGLPVVARPPRPTEKLLLWVRRRPALAGLALASVVAVGALGWSLWQRTVNSRTERLRREFNYVADLNLVKQALTESNSVVFERAMSDASPGPGEEDLRGIEWGLLQTIRETVTHPVWFRGGQPLGALAVSDSAGWTAVQGTNAVFLLDAAGAEKRRWLWRTPVGVGALAFAPGGDWLAVGHGAGLEWVSVSGDRRESLATGAVFGLAISSDGRWLAASVAADGAGGEPGRIRVFDLASRTLLREFDRRGLALAWTPDGGRLRVGGDRGEILESLPGGESLGEIVPGGYRCPGLALSGDGRWAIRTSIYGMAHVFDAGTGAEGRAFRGLPVGEVRMAFSPEGRRLALTATETAVRVVGVEGEGPDLEVFPGHVGAIASLAFAERGKVLLSASRDGTVRRMDLGARRPEPFLRLAHALPTGAGVAPRFSPDGRRVALVERRTFMPPHTNEWTMIWDPAVTNVVGRIPAEVVAWGSDSQVLTWDRDGRLRLWDVSNPEVPREGAAFRVNPHHHGKIDSQLADDGRWIVSLTESGEVQAFEVASGAIRIWPGGRGELLAASPGSARVAVAREGGGAFLWDIRSGGGRRLHEAPTAEMRYSPSGRLLAVTDWDRQLRLFDGETGEPLAGLRGHLGAVAAVAFTPDERQLVTGGDDYSLVVWNLATRREVLRLRLDAPVYWIQVSPDQRWLVTGHLPTQVGLRWGSLGPGHYRLWPITGLPTRTPPSRPVPADSVWARGDALARQQPP